MIKQWLEHRQLRKLFRQQEVYKAVIAQNKRSIEHFKKKLVKLNKKINTHMHDNGLALVEMN